MIVVKGAILISLFSLGYYTGNRNRASLEKARLISMQEQHDKEVAVINSSANLAAYLSEQENKEVENVRERIVTNYVIKNVNTECPNVGLSADGVQALNDLVEARP